MNLPEDKKNNKLGSRIASALSFIMLVVIMILISYLVYLKSNNIDLQTIKVGEIFKGNLLMKSPDADGGGNSKIEYNAKDRSFFSTYKGYIVKCTNDSIKFLDKTGEEVWEKTLSISNPIIKTNGSDLLIADSGGKNLYLIRDKEIKWTYKLDNNIINAEISSGGYVSVVHEVKGYKGAVTVFNLQGGPFFTRNIAEGFVITAKVSPKAKQVLINTMDIGGIKANASIELTDMLGNPLGSKIQIEDTLFPSVWYLENETIIGVGESKVLCWNKDGKTKWEAPFEGQEITSSTLLDGKSTVIALGGEGKNGILSGSTSKILTISAEGKQSEIYTVSDSVKNLASRDDVIAVNTGGEVHFISAKGKLLYKYSTKTDVTEVKFFSKDEAAVITKNSVEFIEIKN